MGPQTRALVRLAWSTISFADASSARWSYASILIRIRSPVIIARSFVLPRQTHLNAPGIHTRALTFRSNLSGSPHYDEKPPPFSAWRAEKSNDSPGDVNGWRAEILRRTRREGKLSRIVVQAFQPAPALLFQNAGWKACTTTLTRTAAG